MLDRFFEEESGQGMVGYGLIIALVGVALIFSLSALRDEIEKVFNTAGTKMKEGVTKGTTGGNFITGLF